MAIIKCYENGTHFQVGASLRRFWKEPPTSKRLLTSVAWPRVCLARAAAISIQLLGSLKSLGTEVKKEKFLWKGSLATGMLPAWSGPLPGQELHTHTHHGDWFVRFSFSP